MGENGYMGILARLGFGKFPEKEKNLIPGETIQTLLEKISVTVTWRKFKSPGKYFGLKKSAFVGSIMITSHRVTGCVFSKPIIDVPFGHPSFKHLSISIEKDKRLLIQFDASHFIDRASGSMEIRFHTPRAGELEMLLEDLGAGKTKGHGMTFG